MACAGSNKARRWWPRVHDIPANVDAGSRLHAGSHVLRAPWAKEGGGWHRLHRPRRNPLPLHPQLPARWRPQHGRLATQQADVTGAAERGRVLPASRACAAHRKSPLTAHSPHPPPSSTIWLIHSSPLRPKDLTFGTAACRARYCTLAMDNGGNLSVKLSEAC